MLEAADNNADIDGRATRWDAHKVQRRSKVLDAAVGAIEQDGPNVGVKRISDLAGLPRSVIYRHFTDRSDLDEHIRQRIVDRLMAELAPTLRPDGSASEAIRRAVSVYLRWTEQHPRLHAFLGTGGRHTTGASSHVVDGTKTAISVEVAELFAQALRRFDRDIQISTPLAFGLVGLVDAAVNRWLVESDSTLTTERLADLLSRSIWLVLEGNLQAMGIDLTPDTPVKELLGD